MSEESNILSPLPVKAARDMGKNNTPDSSDNSSVMTGPPPPASATPLQSMYTPVPGLARTKTHNYKSELEAQLMQGELSKEKTATSNYTSDSSHPSSSYIPPPTEVERRNSEKMAFEHMQPQFFKRKASHIGHDEQDLKSDVDNASVISDVNSNLYTSGQKPHLLDHNFPRQVIHDIKEKLKVVDDKIPFHSPFSHGDHHIHGQGHAKGGLENGELSSTEITPTNRSNTDLESTKPPLLGSNQRKSFSFNDYKKDMYRKSLSESGSTQK